MASTSTETFNNTTVQEAYAPTNWECGETITAEKLNKVEDRLVFVGGGTFPIGVEIVEDDFLSAKVTKLKATANEIITAMKCGKVPAVMLDSTGSHDAIITRLLPIVRCAQEPSTLTFYIATDSLDSELTNVTFTAGSLADYPAHVNPK